MRRLITIILLSACPALCLWTPNEIVQLQKFNGGLTVAEDALLYLGYSVNSCTIEGTTRPYLASAWHDIVSAHRDWTKSYAFLLQANPAISGTAPYDTWTRSQWVAAAWSNMDHGTIFQTASLTDLNNVLAVPGLSAACVDNLTRAKSDMVAAQTQLQGVDRTISYANPFGTDDPQVIGPHGTRADVMHYFYVATNYWSDGEDYAQGMYARTSETYTANGYYAFSRVPLRHVSMERHIRIQWLHSALVVLNAADCPVNAFHLVADQMWSVLANNDNGLTGVSADVYGLFQDANLLMLNEVAAKSAQTRSDSSVMFQKFQDGWRYSDNAVWKLLQFPNPAKLGQVTGQATAPGGIYGPPACP